jgi:hypothetical protein
MIRAHVATASSASDSPLCGECFSGDILKNAVSQLRKWHVLVSAKDESGAAVVSLGCVVRTRACQRLIMDSTLWPFVVAHPNAIF